MYICMYIYMYMYVYISNGVYREGMLVLDLCEWECVMRILNH